MTKNHVQVAYVLAFLLSASVTAQGILSMESSLTGSVVSLRPFGGVLSQDEQLLQRRTNHEAQTLCGALNATGTEVDCPDVNRRWQVERFLTTPTTHSAAPARDDVLEATDLSAGNRALLRQYLHAGRCPQTMRRILPGFYELCLSLSIDPKNRVITQPAQSTAAQRREARKQTRLQGE